MTTTAPERVREEPGPDGEETQGRRWTSVVALVFCVVVLLYAAGRVWVHDPTELQVSGDQASFVLQAVSLADGDLSYDEQDYEGWLDVGWEPQARGLFLQRNDEGWAFAKPYGYSVLLAPAIEFFGADGISYVNAGLLLGYAWLWYAIGRTRWRPPAAALVATAAAVASNAWPMAFPAHADLFVAVVVGVVVLASVRMVLGGPVDRLRGLAERAPLSPAWRILWPCIAAFAAGVLVTEKLPALVAIGPLVAMALWRSPMRGRIAAVAVGVVVVAVSVVPYLYYSDGVTWNAYGGDRYYTPGSAPWSGGLVENLVPWRTSDDMSVGRVIDRTLNPSDDLPSAALTYVVGRHTGAITNQPVIATLGVAALLAVWHRRRSRPDDADVERAGVDSADDEVRWSRLALGAAVLGVVGYASLYLIAFTDNYFGGGQSVGNRYFLQISVLVAVVPVAARISERAAGWAAVVGAAIAFAVITPHLVGADDAFFYIERTSWLQDQLPFEETQDARWRLQCDPDFSCFPRPTSGGDAG